MKILCTGSSGFIGSHLIDFLLKQPEVELVVNIDCLTYAGNRLNNRLAKADPRYVFEGADIRQLEALREVFDRYGLNFVFSLAASTHVDNSIAKPDDFITTNVVGTFNMLDSARAAGVERFVYVSTDETYGSQDPGTYATESSPFRPSSPYSASKASADLLVQAWIKTYGFPALIVRPANCYGPRQHIEKLIPKAITNILTGKPIPLYGNGQQIRDWLYVNDLVRGLWRVMIGGCIGEAYNFRGCGEITNLALIEQIRISMGEPTSPISFVADRPGHDIRYAMGGDKAVEHVYWQPTTKLEDGLKTTIEYYRHEQPH